MKNFKIITILPLMIFIIIHLITELSDFTVGLGYGLSIGILILGLLPKEKLKSLKKHLLKK